MPKHNRPDQQHGKSNQPNQQGGQDRTRHEQDQQRRQQHTTEQQGKPNPAGQWTKPKATQNPADKHETRTQTQYNPNRPK